MSTPNHTDIAIKLTFQRDKTESSHTYKDSDRSYETITKFTATHFQIDNLTQYQLTYSTEKDVRKLIKNDVDLQEAIKFAQDQHSEFLHIQIEPIHIQQNDEAKNEDAEHPKDAKTSNQAAVDDDEKKQDPELAAMAKLLESQISAKMYRSGSELSDINRDSVLSPRIAATSKQLNKRLKADKLAQSLNARSVDPADIGVDSRVAPKIAATSKELESQLKADKLAQSLNARSVDPADIGVDNRVAPKIAATSKELETQLKKDKLSQSLAGNKGVVNQQETEQKDGDSKGDVVEENHHGDEQQETQDID